MAGRVGDNRGVEIERTQIAIGVEGMSNDEQISVCRSAMAIFQHDVSTGECDIPWGAGPWPADVRKAAMRLSLRAGISEHEYARTGLLLADQDCWRDFVIFVPYALDATFWSAQHVDVISIADESTSLVFRATAQQVAAMQKLVDPSRVTILKSRRQRWVRWWDRQQEARGTGGL